MMTRISAKKCFVLLLVILALASCHNRGGRQEIRLAYIAANADLPVFVANQNHYFSRHQLGVRLVRTNDSSEALNALLSGQVDAVGGLTFGVYFPAEVQDAGKFKLFQPFAETDESPMSYLLAGAHAPEIQKPLDLKGKRVGTYTGASQLVYLKLFLKTVGLDPARDVEIVQVGMNLQAQALAARQFDALFTVEPYGTIALRTAGARVVLANPRSRLILNPFWVGASAVRSDYLKDHSGAITALRQALDEAVDEIRKNPLGTKALLPLYAPLDKETAVNSGLYTWFRQTDRIDTASIQRLATLMQENGLIERRLENVARLFL